MKLGNKNLPVGLVQGGMGIGISMGNLAGHVARCGGMGVISTANTGFRDPHFVRSPIQSNQISLMKEIRKARDLSQGRGLIAINAMVATTGCDIQISQAIQAGIDCIIAGAGLPVKLPELVGDRDIAIAPIVSSGRAIDSITRYWMRRYKRAPDFVIVEGPEAGGHLGFAPEELHRPPSLESIVAEVHKVLIPLEESQGRRIPIFAAGGVNTRSRVEQLRRVGATGIQLGSRFVATHECDASDGFKEMFVKHSSQDLVIIKSPAGLPGRAIRTNLIEALKKVPRIPPNHCVDCLITCEPAKTTFCISRALAEAQRGNEVEGLFFAGHGIDAVTEITSVEAVFDEFMPNWRDSWR
ncbi:MAG: nitronate monooxygenase family protein [Eubacteriales bacterium]